jgi:hypothetical protein
MTRVVAVEKLPLRPKRPKFGDRKCPAIREERLKRILTQFYFCEFGEKEFFNSYRCLRVLTAGDFTVIRVLR